LELVLLRIDLTNFTEGMSVSFEENLLLPPAYAPLENPVKVTFQGTLGQEADYFILTGELRARLSYPCARCLTPTPWAARLAVREFFSQNPREEMWPLAGNRAELAPMVETLLFQNIPLKLLCNEDCDGASLRPNNGDSK
jgi:uncharacterized metal-binding protein YceD (DUF177 family)